MGYPETQHFREGISGEEKDLFWTPGGASGPSVWTPPLESIARFRERVHIIQNHPDTAPTTALGGSLSQQAGEDSYRVLGSLPPLYPEWLGNRKFSELHGLRFPYLAGAMATGIGSVAIVTEMARAGMMGFFGSAGLRPERVREAIQEIQSELQDFDLPYGINFIHFPMDPSWEEKLVDIFLETGVKRIEASAFLRLTPALIRYVAKGLSRDPQGRIQRRHFVFAKLSHPDVAKQFMDPAPETLLKGLLDAGKITEAEAEMAREVPVAMDITLEADSGGHTDNRPLTALWSTIHQLGLEKVKEHSYPETFRIGVAGGLGTPEAVAAAYSLGAAYVLTGSINQACVESGQSSLAKEMLGKARMDDVMMAPAADMFEMGVKVQVLKKGTLWPVRAQKLYDLYRNYKSFDSIPASTRKQIETDFLRAPFEQIWEETQSYFQKVDPTQVERAGQDPQHKMALVFRWYLGMGSRWARQGDPDRKSDYQIWCGPAQGAFNSWVKGSFLEPVENRRVAEVALNLMEGAAQITRANQLRNYGIEVVQEAFAVQPKALL